MKREHNLTLDQITEIVMSSPGLPVLKEKVQKMNADKSPRPVSELRGIDESTKIETVLCTVTQQCGETRVLVRHGALADRKIETYDSFVFVGTRRRKVSIDEALQILKGVIPWKGKK